MRYRNSDVHARVFLGLVNPETGTTLELAPGEEVELTEEINDAHLVPVRGGKKARVEPDPKPVSEEASKEEL